MDHVEEEEAATEVEATEVVITAVATGVEATEVVITAVATEVEATEVVILDLIALTPINLLEQKVGKTEVMEILQKTPNTKVVGAGEKGECLVRVMLQMRQINNPFLLVLSLI